MALSWYTNCHLQPAVEDFSKQSFHWQQCFNFNNYCDHAVVFNHCFPECDSVIRELLGQDGKPILQHGPHTANFDLKWAKRPAELHLPCLFIINYFGIVLMTMREVFISRKSCKTCENIVKSLKNYALLHIFENCPVGQTLPGRLRTLGLMFDTLI